MNELIDRSSTRKRTAILVYHVGSIGDTIVALPAFRTLRFNFPDAELRLVNLSVADEPIHSELYEQSRLFFRHIFWKPPKNILQKIRLYFRFLGLTLFQKYDALYCFSPDLPKTLVAFWKILQRTPVHHVFLFEKMGNIPLYRAYLDRLKELGMTIPDGCFEFEKNQDAQHAAQTLAARIGGSRQVRFFVFGIGGNQPVCRWQPDRYSELIEKLKERADFLPVYAGGEGDRTVAELLMTQHGGIFLPDTECRTLLQTMAFFRLCECYIGNDTGTMHLAAAAGIPCAVIMSAHNEPEREWYPFGERNLILRKQIECAGCREKICPKGEQAPCMDFSADEVAEKVLAWLVGLRNDSENTQMWSFS